jgi:hypothetical protein
MIARVSFRVSSYYKRGRGEAGITSMESIRMDFRSALKWILEELPADAYSVMAAPDGDKTVITINWDLIPPGLIWETPENEEKET